MSRPGKGGVRSGATTRRNFLKSAAAWGTGAPALARGAQGGAGGTVLAYVGSYTLPAGPDGMVGRGEGILMKCIRSLPGPKLVTSALLPVVAGVILIATAVAGMATWPNGQHDFNATRRLASIVEGNPYKGWLDGPVSYLIQPRERGAFEKLTTDQERNRFIQQFWERRNPSPGSRTNAFKEEFFRRVNFADAHFAAGYPGWKSDRGHMYIDYGPPDEIEFHPNSTPYHFSVWKYRSLPKLGENVVFVFVDLAGNGDYRIATPPWK